ncbi:MAG: hypothetical protein ACRDM1_00300 [Gaiellaceae bacterium]
MPSRSSTGSAGPERIGWYGLPLGRMVGMWLAAKSAAALSHLQVST